jgi:hypothetical protein
MKKLKKTDSCVHGHFLCPRTEMFVHGQEFFFYGHKFLSSDRPLSTGPTRPNTCLFENVLEIYYVMIC